MTVSISAVLITLNAERHLDRVLAALRGTCAEIVVLDSGSTDRTAAICAAHGVRFEVHPFDGYGPQKRRAVALATHDWVLSVDADEVLDATASAALAQLDLSEPRRSFRILRRNFIGEREVRYGAWSPDWCLRLFNRTTTNFTMDAVHESVPAVGPVAVIPGSLLHYSFSDAADLFVRCGGYARRKAARYRAAGRRAGACRVLLRALWGFTRSYVLKRGFLDGKLGVVVALSVAVDNTVPLTD
jgi:glycosyltransferase involved in cell wall biosynthesis